MLLNVLEKVIDTVQNDRVVPDKEKLVIYAKEFGMDRGILKPYLDWIMNQIKRSRRVDEPDLQERVTDLDLDQKIEDIKNSVSNVYELGDQCESMRDEINILRNKGTVAKNLLDQLLNPSNKDGFPSKIVRYFQSRKFCGYSGGIFSIFHRFLFSLFHQFDPP